MNGVVYTLRAYTAAGMLLEPEHGCDERVVVVAMMDLHSDPLRDGVDFNRRQFPVRLAWACHPQSAGSYAREVRLVPETDCFSHGQYYTAITRAGTVEACGIRVPPDCIEERDGEAYVRNVVDTCLLLPAAAAAARGGETRGNVHSSAYQCGSSRRQL